MNNHDPYFKKTRTLYLIGSTVIAVALVLVFILWEKRSSYLGGEVKSRAAEIASGTEVRAITAKRSPAQRSISQVGEARPYTTITLYAKVSGYIKEIRVDKGDRVKTGQVLAVIESPELDRQVEAALADARDKRRDAGRSKVLVEKGFISQQDADHAETAAQMSEANAESLRAQKNYEVLRAPYPAVVTARFADPGALIQSAVSAQTTALPVLTLSRTNRLRVYVYLDQRDAAFVRVGDVAEISDTARPEVRLPASVSRISGELDARTRTLLTELDVENKGGALLAGSFVQVSLTLKTAPAVEIPAEALLMKGDSPAVAVISPDHKVGFRPVVILDSDAKTVSLSSGLKEGELVILNPGWGIAEGAQVRPIVPAAK